MKLKNILISGILIFASSAVLSVPLLSCSNTENVLPPIEPPEPEVPKPEPPKPPSYIYDSYDDFEIEEKKIMDPILIEMNSIYSHVNVYSTVQYLNSTFDDELNKYVIHYKFTTIVDGYKDDIKVETKFVYFDIKYLTDKNIDED